MDIRLHDDVDAFAALAGPLLDADPLRHNIALMVLDALCRVGGLWQRCSPCTRLARSTRSRRAHATRTGMRVEVDVRTDELP